MKKECKNQKVLINRKVPFSGSGGALIVAVTLMINSGYYLSTIRDSYFPLILLIIVTGLLTICTLPRMRVVLNSDNIAPLLLLFGIVMSSMVNFSLSNILSGGRVAVTMICSYIILTRMDTKQLLKTYAGLIRLIIILSAVLYILSSQFSLSFLPTINTSNGVYYNLLIITQKVSSTARVSGAFWEPGVFASHIVLCMLFEIYFLKNKAIHVLIYLVGMFITGSTAGLLIMLFGLIGYILKKSGASEKKYVEVLFFILILVGIFSYESIFSLLSSISPKFFSKLMETDSSTFYTRMNSPLVNLELFFGKPLFGWGFTDAATQYSLKMDAKLVAQTSTSTQIMSAIGILGVVYTLLCLSPLFSKKRLSHLSLIDKSIVSVSLLLLVNKEPHIFFAITWLTLFLVARSIRNKNEGSVCNSVQMQEEGKVR